MSLWVPVHQTLVRHPKLRRCARDLGMERPELIGRLVCMWLWALDYAPDGAITAPDDLADALDLVDVNVAIVAGAALAHHGFLDTVVVNESWTIHDWDEYGGKATGARAARQADGAYGNHVRWHVNQERVAEDCQWCSPPDSPPDGGGSRRAEQTREEEIRAAAEPTRAELYDEASLLADERIAEGYKVDNREAYISHLASHAEVKHRARKRKWSNA